MPEYLNVEPEVDSMTETELLQMLEEQFANFRTALVQWDEQDRTASTMYEKVVSI